MTPILDFKFASCDWGQVAANGEPRTPARFALTPLVSPELPEARP